MSKHDVVNLEASIKELEKDLSRLAHDAEFQELLKIIHRPGYTTPAEFTLTVGIVNTMIAQTRALAALKQALLLGNREIVEKAAGATSAG